jgi:hypothetical protein
MSTEPNLVEVYVAANVLNAHTVQAALEEAGIPAIVDQENLQNMFGDLQGETAPRLLVAESQADAARALIAKVEHNQSFRGEDEASGDDQTCLRCGKRLAPNEETCSACGWSFRQADGAEPVGPM